MTILFFDGFERYEPTDADLWSANISPIILDTEDQARSLWYNNSNQSRIGYIDGSNNDECWRHRLRIEDRKEIIIGCAVYLNSFPFLTEVSIMSVDDRNARPTACIELLNDGRQFDWRFRVTRFTDYNDPTVLLVESEKGIRPGDWHYLEWYITIDNVTGATILKVDGEEYINATGLDTQATATSGIGLLRFGANGYRSSNGVGYDDIYVCDFNGTITGFLGPQVTVESLFPTGTGLINDWIGSDGNSVDNHLLVDTINGSNVASTNYVESSGLNETDLYQITDLSSPQPDTISGIHAIKLITYEQYDSGTITGAMILNVDGSIYTGDSSVNATPVFGTRHYEYSMFTGNPHTGSGWSVDDINNLQIGKKIVGL